MRSLGLSTNVAKSTLRLIFDYGYEALGNRRKDLFLIAFIFIFLPQVILTLAWAESAKLGVEQLKELSSKSTLLILTDIYELVASRAVSAGILATILGVIGVLALARTCVDYFESRPSSFADVLKRSLWIFARKGVGTLIFFLILLPIFAHPLLRAISISMLVMLPITLVVSPKGGFLTTWDTLFVTYAKNTRIGRLPTFFNVLAFSGLFLTLLFIVSLLIESLQVVDTLLTIPAGVLETEITIFSYRIGVAQLIGQGLSHIWMCIWMAIVMPFAAAAYHLSTTPDDHVTFEATA